MAKYLGETLVTDLSTTPYKDYTPAKWALEWIGVYGGIDGAHHKNWLLDQVAQILNGTPVILKLAKWDDGEEEYRFSLAQESIEHTNWITQIMDGDVDEYDYGIAP